MSYWLDLYRVGDDVEVAPTVDTGGWGRPWLRAVVADVNSWGLRVCVPLPARNAIAFIEHPQDVRHVDVLLAAVRAEAAS